MEDAQRTSPALGTTKEVTGTTSVVPTGPSTATLPPEDGPEVMAPLILEDAGLRSSCGLERVDDAEFLSSGAVQGSWKVLAPRGLPPNPLRCLRDEPVPILNWDCSSDGALSR